MSKTARPLAAALSCALWRALSRSMKHRLPRLCWWSMVWFTGMRDDSIVIAGTMLHATLVISNHVSVRVMVRVCKQVSTGGWVIIPDRAKAPIIGRDVRPYGAPVLQTWKLSWLRNGRSPGNHFIASLSHQVLVIGRVIGAFAVGVGG